MYYIAVYDVNQKRVGKMLKLFRRYLNHVQNSVFEGELKDSDFLRLKAEAQALMNETEDSLIFYMLNGKYLERETLGVQKNEPTNFI
ncbi:MAG: CRISPR-associated endonuclease Cas2 [Chloroherpetonaceae bacterium]|nr:CRISPR-associated endonuclease Cas2 [Chloroherpetonaceae bacterium]MDW8464759.1 CRISPR-associated endonuclease Cas2 [Chloroherpetonaceae bacterium]